MPRFDRRQDGRAWIASVLAFWSFGAGFAAAQEAGSETESTLSRPVYLEGVNLSLPAQEAFREWPADSLRERPYWLPWGSLSFTRTVLFDRPVLFLLSAPWSRHSQRMWDETLTDPGVLRVMNDGFIGIRVDADRRPDIRERYQTGTWPVIAFLLPDGVPMLSTNNPRQMELPITTGAVNAEGMRFLLEEGKFYYELQKSTLERIGDVWVKNEGDSEPVPGEVVLAASDEMARWLLANADGVDGGFGAAPRFVLPWLAEYGALRDARFLPRILDHARLTLTRMIESPLFDFRDGGVHRIAVMPDWKGLQYEKMLDKNAFLIRELMVALRAADDPALRAALRKTAGFLTTVLGRPGGGFRLAQIADPTSPDGGAYWREPPSPDRPAPRVDPLVLAGPNALAGAALLRAGELLDDDEMRDTGRAALDLVFSEAYRPARGAIHVIDPLPDQRLYLETQADVALGFLDAYETTGETRWLEAGQDVVDFALANLAGPEAGPLRDHYPDAVPLGLLANVRRPARPNSRLARAMIRLSLHGRGERYRDRAAVILAHYTGEVSSYRAAGIELAIAIEEWGAEPLVVTVEGPGDAPLTTTLRRAALNLPWGWTVVRTGARDGVETGARLARGGSEVRVTDPEQLRSEARRLIGAIESGAQQR